MVNTSPNGHIYALSWYLDITAKEKWMLVTNEKMDLGFPIACKKRTGYSNIYQPFYTMFFNPAGHLSIDDAIETGIKKNHHLHITTETKPTKHSFKERVRQELSLDNFTYSENALRQVKKAVKNQLEFSYHESAAGVVKLFKDNKGKELKEYKTTDFSTLKLLIEKSIEKKHGFCAQVKTGNTILASGFFLTYGNRIIFLKGGVSDEGKDMGAMYFLMHHVMEDAKNKYRIFDFGGSNNKNVAVFYHRLGGKDVTYYEVEIDQRNILHKMIGKLRK